MPPARLMGPAIGIISSVGADQIQLPDDLEMTDVCRRARTARSAAMASATARSRIRSLLRLLIRTPRSVCAGTRGEHLPPQLRVAVVDEAAFTDELEQRL